MTRETEAMSSNDGRGLFDHLSLAKATALLVFNLLLLIVAVADDATMVPYIIGGMALTTVAWLCVLVRVLRRK